MYNPYIFHYILFETEHFNFDKGFLQCLSVFDIMKIYIKKFCFLQLQKYLSRYLWENRISHFNEFWITPIRREMNRYVTGSTPFYDKQELFVFFNRFYQNMNSCFCIYFSYRTLMAKCKCYSLHLFTLFVKISKFIQIPYWFGVSITA